VAATLAACGELTPTGAPSSTDGTAEQLFARLHPTLSAECGRCHGDDDSRSGPEFIAENPAEGRQALLTYRSSADARPLVGPDPAASLLYTYGQHRGPPLSPPLADLVEVWIQREAEEADSGPDGGVEVAGTGPPATLVEAARRFGDCIAYSDFVATNFQDVANQNTDGGRCYACHDRGTGGAYLSAADAELFTFQRRTPFLYKLAIGTVSDSGAFDELVPAYRYRDKGQDDGHPSYILSAGRLEAIDAMFEATYRRYRATFADPPVACEPDLPPPR
jgi:mono/diheme cytochrome c family protein